MTPLDHLPSGPDPTVVAILIGLLIASLATAVWAHAEPWLGPSRRLRRRIDRTRLGAGAERASSRPATSGSVRRQPARTMLGQAGRSLTRLLPRAEVMRRRLDQSGS